MVLTVIIPVFNAEEYIRTTLDSVKNQSYNFFEVIIVDDGSTDGSENICIDYLCDSRFRYYKIKNSGVSIARNYGLKQAKGDWILFLDSDDKFAPHLFERIVDYLNKNDTDLLCFGYKCIKNGSVFREYNVIDNHYEKSQLHEGIQCLHKNACLNVAWNKVFKNEIIKKNNLQMDKTLWMGEDFMFVMDYLEYINCFDTLSFVGYLYTLDSNGLTKKTQTNEFKNRISQEKRVEMFVRKFNGDLTFLYYAYIKIAIHCLSRVVKDRVSFKMLLEEISSDLTIQNAYNYIKNKKNIYSFFAYLMVNQNTNILLILLVTKSILER